MHAENCSAELKLSQCSMVMLTGL